MMAPTRRFRARGLVAIGAMVACAMMACSSKKAGNGAGADKKPIAVNSGNHPPLSPMLQQGECETDGECELTDLDNHTCCSSCRRRGLTHEKALALRVACSQGVANCPKLECEYVRYEAKCLEGRCIALTGQ